MVEAVTAEPGIGDCLSPPGTSTKRHDGGEYKFGFWRMVHIVLNFREEEQDKNVFIHECDDTLRLFRDYGDLLASKAQCSPRAELSFEAWDWQLRGTPAGAWPKKLRAK